MRKSIGHMCRKCEYSLHLRIMDLHVLSLILSGIVIMELLAGQDECKRHIHLKSENQEARKFFIGETSHLSKRLLSYIQRISCSRFSKYIVEKNSERVISKPSQSFFIVTIPGLLLSPFRMLLIVACGTAATFER